MEEARRKLRICLIFVVTLAVMVGCIYYFNDVKKKENIDGGTLVMSQLKSREAEYGIKQ